MNKEQRAHEYALKMLENLNPMQLDKPTRDGIAYECFELADAMQAEADKREKEKQDKAKQEQQNYEDALNSIGVEQWQPDWSQAPKGSDAWRMYVDGNCAWLVDIDGDFKWWSPAPSFDYQGNWKNSLRKRPQGI